MELNGRSALLLHASSTSIQPQRAFGAAVVGTRESASRPKTMSKIAISEVEAQHRAAETTISGLIELEAGLEGDALDRRTYRPAVDFQSARRQPSRALRTGTAKLDGAADGAVTV